jgi:hypothetical protein
MVIENLSNDQFIFLPCLGVLMPWWQNYFFLLNASLEQKIQSPGFLIVVTRINDE